MMSKVKKEESKKEHEKDIKKNVEKEDTKKDIVKKETNKEIKTKEENKFKKIVKELIPYVVILVVVVLIRTFIFTPVIVSGPSMKPTLDGGEILILNKMNKSYDRFDIVVAEAERNGNKDEIIKRVIALPGETIVCENGILYVNGRKLEENYGIGNTRDFELVKLGDDEYFLMGDNRENSADSRDFGPFRVDKIKGETKLVLFPFNKIGNIEKNDE